MNVLLVDDHPLIRSALETVLRGLDHDVQLMSALSAEEARQALSRDIRFDLLLLDLQLPDVQGMDLLVELRRRVPDLPIVVISASERSSDVIRALDEGAMGFVPKRTSNEVLFQALRMVLSGGIYVPPMALRLGGEGGEDDAPSVRHSAPVARSSARAGDESVAFRLGHLRGRPGLRLTPRQGQVLELLLRGLPNKLIARELDLSVETVKDHVASLLRVLGVSSRTQAVLMVNQLLADAEATA